MNNDPLSSAVHADLPPPAAESNPDNNRETVASATSHGESPKQKGFQAQSQKKNDLLAHLLERLDSIIYMELAVLYYMDNSLFRLLLRAINQLMFLTPKPAFLPSAPQHRPYIGAIFAPNIICIILHIFTAHSSASEEMRGYLHGGVILDLIGQKGPTSKMHLVILDVLVWVMQCVMLSVVLEKERIHKVLTDIKGGVRVEVVGNENSSLSEDRNAQDADAEERGILRHGILDTEDLELNDLTSSNRSRTDADEENEHLLAAPLSSSTIGDESHPLDVFYSRTATIATFHVFPALKMQWQDYGNASGSALQTVGFSAEFARVAASRRLGAAGQRFQQQVAASGA